MNGKFCKVYWSLIFKILPFRMTIPNLINMKVIPLEKNHLSSNSSQTTADPRSHEALHTQTLLYLSLGDQRATQTRRCLLWIQLVLQPSNEWEKKSSRGGRTFIIAKPCHVDVAIRWKRASFKYNFTRSEQRLNAMAESDVQKTSLSCGY